MTRGLCGGRRTAAKPLIVLGIADLVDARRQIGRLERDRDGAAEEVPREGGLP